MTKDKSLDTMEELWDKYSEMIVPYRLNYYSGKIILTHENYKKLCNEFSTLQSIKEQESNETKYDNADTMREHYNKRNR